MINKLRRKMMLVATGVVALMLAAVVVTSAALTYYQADQTVNKALDYLIAQKGELPDSADDLNVELVKGNSEEFVFQLRYFSAIINQDGSYQKLNTENIAALSDEQVKSYVGKLKSKALPRGYFEGKDGSKYAYMKSENEDKSQILVVMDVSYYMDTVKETFHTNLMFSVLALTIFVVLLRFFSKRVLRPIIVNMENQRQFITNASHELKTPVAIINANAEALEMIEGENEFTKNIRHQGERLAGLIDNLVALSRATEKGDLVLSDVDCSELARDVAASMEQLAIKQGKQLEKDIAENVHANAEARGLRELMNILVDNAVKYCDERGRIEISLRSGSRGKGMIFQVSNDYKEGEGQDFDRFFDRFYREDKSHSSIKKGYGIGLSMAQTLVQSYKGKITVSYKEGKISFKAVI